MKANFVPMRNQDTGSKSIKMVMFMLGTLRKIKNMERVLSFGLICPRPRTQRKSSSIMETGGADCLMGWVNIKS